MSPPATILTESLLAVIALLVLIGLLLQIRTTRRLERLERLFRQGGVPAGDHGEASADELGAVAAQPGGLFEEFLEEEPARREMSKSEQFAAYRNWRKEKGLNWSAS